MHSDSKIVAATGFPVRTRSFFLSPDAGTAEATARTTTLDDFVEVDGEKVRIGDLVKFAQEQPDLSDEVAQLRQVKEAVIGTVAGTGDQKAHFRTLYQQAGYEGAELERRVAESVSPRQPAGDAQAGRGKPGAKPEADADLEEIISSRTKPVLEAAAKAEAAARRTRLRAAEKEMLVAAREGLASNPEIEKMLKAIDQSQGREAAQRAYKSLLEQSQDDLMRRITDRSKRSPDGEFNEDWFAEEAVNSAAAVHKRFSSVIGDTARIGRSTATEHEEDTLASTKPIEPPKWDEGKKAGDIDQDLAAFTSDALSRLVAEVPSKGESKA